MHLLLLLIGRLPQGFIEIQLVPVAENLHRHERLATYRLPGRIDLAEHLVSQFGTICYVYKSLDWPQSLKQFFINMSYHILVASLTLMALF